MEALRHIVYEVDGQYYAYDRRTDTERPMDTDRALQLLDALKRKARAAKQRQQAERKQQEPVHATQR